LGNNERFLSAALHGLGADFELKVMPDSALFYFKAAAAINLKNGYSSWLGNNYARIADIYLLQKNQFNLFHEYISKAIELFETNADWGSYVQMKHLLAQQYIQQRKMAAVEAILLQTETFIDSSLTVEQKAWYYKIRHNYYKAIGNTAKAYNYLLQQKIYDDSLSKMLNENADREVEARFSIHKKEQENDKLRMNNALNSQIIVRQRILLISFIVLAIFLIVSIILVSRSHSKIKIAHHKLEEQNKRIEKQAEALAHSNASKDKFLSIIAHDLRNPFNAILGFSELLLNSDYEFTEAEKQQFLKSINTSAEHASKLLENLLLWARSRMGKTEFEPQPVDIKGIAFECGEIAKAMADGKHIIIHQDFDNELLAFCDPAMIRTLILNLLTNAIKFTPKHGTITIAGKLVDDHVEVCVEDTGVGISADILGKLFKLNHHVVMPGTESEYGTGMGLLLCDEFIKKNNGKITVFSEENKGSRFCIELPQVEM
jgi:signal transduction histidine kinase